VARGALAGGESKARKQDDAGPFSEGSERENRLCIVDPCRGIYKKGENGAEIKG